MDIVRIICNTLSIYRNAGGRLALIEYSVILRLAILINNQTQYELPLSSFGFVAIFHEFNLQLALI